MLEIRPAGVADHERIVEVWHQGWHEAWGHPFVAQNRRERAGTAARSGTLMQPGLKTKKPAAGGCAAGFPKRTEQRLTRRSAAVPTDAPWEEEWAV